MKFISHDVLRLQVFTLKINDIDNEKLLHEIENTNNQIPNDLIDGFGKTTTHTWFEDGLYPWGMPEARKLISRMGEICSVIANTEMKVDEAWTITLKNGQSVTSHSHRSNWHMYPNEYFSVAYYANAPSGSAPLIFEAGYCDIAQNTYSITPETGMIVVFNSFMKHMTGRHASEEDRVVVSSNLSPINPSMDRSPDLSPYRIGK
jgi:Putative 2OG-Fe(II) oxygenase